MTDRADEIAAEIAAGVSVLVDQWSPKAEDITSRTIAAALREYAGGQSSGAQAAAAKAGDDPPEVPAASRHAKWLMEVANEGDVCDPWSPLAAMLTEIAECLTEHGYGAAPPPSGGEAVASVKDAEDRFGLALCKAELPDGYDRARIIEAVLNVYRATSPAQDATPRKVTR